MRLITVLELGKLEVELTEALEAIDRTDDEIRRHWQDTKLRLSSGLLTEHEAQRQVEGYKHCMAQLQERAFLITQEMRKLAELELALSSKKPLA